MVPWSANLPCSAAMRHKSQNRFNERRRDPYPWPEGFSVRFGFSEANQNQGCGHGPWRDARGLLIFILGKPRDAPF